MNVKGLFGNMMPSPVQSTSRTDKASRIQSDTTHDRDANGQEAYQEQRQREPMSDEQFAKAVQYLKDLPAMKEHKWTIEVVGEVGKRFVYVRDNLGSIIRKIPELELWALPTDQSDKKGQLLKKAA